ncbi:MAG: hypothetical protein JXR60_11545 [Bacteroidales bacterium]|nr:hypothetical protein [Bacteroidales bacterium]
MKNNFKKIDWPYVGLTITLISLLSLLFIALSCSPELRIARKQAKYCNKIEHSDTFKIVRVDTVREFKSYVVKQAPSPDTLKLLAMAYCDSLGMAQMEKIFLKDKGHIAEITIQDNQLNAQIICNTDSLVQLILEKNTLINKLENTKITNEKLRYIETSPFYKWFFWITIAVAVMVVAYHLRRHYIKIDIQNPERNNKYF